MPGIFLGSQAAWHLSATQLKSRNFAKKKNANLLNCFLVSSFLKRKMWLSMQLLFSRGLQQSAAAQQHREDSSKAQICDSQQRLDRKGWQLRIAPCLALCRLGLLCSCMGLITYCTAHGHITELKGLSPRTLRQKGGMSSPAWPGKSIPFCPRVGEFSRLWTASTESCFLEDRVELHHPGIFPPPQETELCSTFSSKNFPFSPQSLVNKNSPL